MQKDKKADSGRSLNAYTAQAKINTEQTSLLGGPLHATVGNTSWCPIQKNHLRLLVKGTHKKHKTEATRRDLLVAHSSLPARLPPQQHKEKGPPTLTESPCSEEQRQTVWNHRPRKSQGQVKHKGINDLSSLTQEAGAELLSHPGSRVPGCNADCKINLLPGLAPGSECDQQRDQY